MMNKFEPLLTKILEFVLALGLLAIALIIVTLVVLRYAFNSSITGANETITILFVYTTAIGAAVAIGQREHISISAVVDRLPIRTQRFIDGVTLVCVAILNTPCKREDMDKGNRGSWPVMEYKLPESDWTAVIKYTY